MHAFMNKDAFEMTIKTKEAHYFSRSQNKIWHKGDVSGFVQKVKFIKIDDDQDAVWISVDIGDGASCHVGYKSCFYRSIPIDLNTDNIKLNFNEKEKNLNLRWFTKVSQTQPNFK